ncbi:MAG: hypothetical protein KDK90_12995 [Leptospiraceae bacterium]|nr:hypothetical protein [Leptospiraceae bacterium]
MVKELEIFIVAKTKESSSTSYMEKIFPIEKDNIGIQAEILVLSENMKIGFQAVEKQIQAVEKQVQAVERHVLALEKTMDKRFEAVEKRIDFQTKLLWLVIAILVTSAGSFISFLVKNWQIGG